MKNKKTKESMQVTFCAFCQSIYNSNLDLCPDGFTTWAPPNFCSNYSSCLLVKYVDGEEKNTPPECIRYDPIKDYQKERREALLDGLYGSAIFIILISLAFFVSIFGN